MKIVPQEPDNGAVIMLGSREIPLTWKQLYELSVCLSQLELCHECYRPVEPESSMGNGYHPGCFQNMMDRFR